MGEQSWLQSLRLFGRHGRLKLSWPTRITLMRILLLAPFVSCMLKINDPELTLQTRALLRYTAIAIYCLMAVSDALDGCLARRLKEITQLGAFLDPVADKLLITSACLLLMSERGHIEGFLLPPTVVVIIIGKDLLLVIGFVIVYLITSQVHVAPVWAGKLATALQLAMIAGVLLAPEISVIIPAWRRVLSLLWWSAAGTAILATLIYIRRGSYYVEQYERRSTNTE
jgi:cardiolipin synthase